MQLIYEDKAKRTIANREEIRFSGFSSYHLITITARVKSRKQLSGEFKNYEQLTVTVDGQTFPPSGSQKPSQSPAAFQGWRLRNLAKTVYFLTFLKGRDHAIRLETGTSPNTAALENLSVYAVNLDRNFVLEVNNQAEDGDRRPWLAFALNNLPLTSVIPTLTYARRKRDSDDVKIKIDGRLQGNILKRTKHFLWRFVGSRLPWSVPEKTEAETFMVNLPRGLHYIEFDADRMPILHEIVFDFGEAPGLPAGVMIPTVGNPRTGREDYSDDPDDILLARVIFGEAGGQSREAKAGVGFTVLNRAKRQGPDWRSHVRGTILKQDQYEALWHRERGLAVRDPLKEADALTVQAWRESYEIAVALLEGKFQDPTRGATNFHSYPEEEKHRFPSWATKENFRTKIGAIYFYALEE